MGLIRALAQRLAGWLARPGRRRYSTRSIVFGTSAVVLALVLVSGLLTAYLTYRSDWNGIRRISVQRDISAGVRRPAAVPGAMNILLIGSDSRAGTGSQFGAGITGQRSDTVMVVHVAPGAHQVVVLSLPRDTVVPILSCAPEAGTPGQQAAAGRVEQLNATFAYGGPGCLWKTIEQVTGIHLDNFIEVTFTGFEHVIDDLGGVSICLPTAVNDPRSRLDLSAGRHHVYGREALAFWRERYIGEGSDLQRIQRDQYLMAAVLQGIAYSGLVRDPLRLLRVIGDLARGHYITTDSGLTIGRLLSIAETLRSLPTRAVRFIEAPTVPYPGDPAAWVQWAEPGAARLFSAIAHDTRLPASQRLAPGGGRNTPVLASLRARPVLTTGHRARPAPRRRTTTSMGRVISSLGGISGSAPICSDSAAFAGPDGS
jgi:LCP family protein required for cell wall assembly